MPYSTIDLNADLGETEGDYLPLLPLITSANVACGGHAGGGELLEKTVAAAINHGVQVGAHPSYPDRDNFGRVSLRGQISNLTEVIAKQIHVVMDVTAKHGKAISHIKAHGALYNDAMVHEDVAKDFIEAVKQVAPQTKVLGLPNSVLAKVCLEAGIEFIPEGYLDRAYSADGTLVPRSQSGAVLNHAEALLQIQHLIETGKVKTNAGNELELDIRTLCVHADTPDAARTVADVRKLLESTNVRIESF